MEKRTCAEWRCHKSINALLNSRNNPKPHQKRWLRRRNFTMAAANPKFTQFRK